MDFVAQDLVYDWNIPQPVRPGLSLLDETLRDGLQSASVSDPPIAEKIRLLHLMEDLGIEAFAAGMPASGARAFADVLRLCQEVARCGMRIRVVAAGRTLPADVAPILEISQRAGHPVDAYLFVGSSPIRQAVESWDARRIALQSVQSVHMAARAGLSVAYVTEDTTRSRPEVLRTLFRAAIDHGATRLCLSDTAGHALPSGVRALAEFARGVIDEAGAAVGLDWHGHNDRGLALSNALCAVECGVDRIHGTALGIGERAGNPPIELLLLNLRMLDGVDRSSAPSRLVEYCEAVARALQWELSPNWPLVGRDAFRTAAGVHAAAVSKALERGDVALADHVYSSVPAAKFGRRQEIAVGFMSGSSNVAYWLRERGIEPTEGLVGAVLRAAKAGTRVLSDDELMTIVREVSSECAAERSLGHE
ncbi:MAG: 2-isopropylmalate synthase [Polyangiaceae bacterium]|jgi:2-isopropylmalate synthase